MEPTREYAAEELADLDPLDLLDQIAALSTENQQLRTALIWCSGSPSFAPEGEARVGWLKVCAPLLKYHRIEWSKD